MRCIIFWGLNPKKEKRLHVEQLLSDNSWPLLSALANGNRLMTQAEAKLMKQCTEYHTKSVQKWSIKWHAFYGRFWWALHNSNGEEEDTMNLSASIKAADTTIWLMLDKVNVGRSSRHPYFWKRSTFCASWNSFTLDCSKPIKLSCGTNSY